MREVSTDVAIIGAGSAGLNARREVARTGKSWLLIESGSYSTTCARVGFLPSKECGSHRLLGAEMFGPAVEHTAHLLAWAVQSKLSVQQLLQMPVYHPTLEEGVRTALRDAAQKLELMAGCAPADRGIGPGV